MVRRICRGDERDHVRIAYSPEMCLLWTQSSSCEGASGVMSFMNIPQVQPGLSRDSQKNNVPPERFKEDTSVCCANLRYAQSPVLL